MNARIDILERRLESEEKARREIQDSLLKQALLKSSEKGWDIFSSTLGPLTAQLVSITPAGAGSKVTLDIGNPTSATITKLTLFGSWGAVDKEGAPEAGHTIGMPDITSRIEPGHWNRVSFVIDGAKPTEIGYVRLTGSSAATVSMSR